VVFDEDRLSYISATDYKAYLHSVDPILRQEHEELEQDCRHVQQELQGQRDHFAMTQEELSAQMQDLESALRQHQAEIDALRANEEQVTAERDRWQQMCEHLSKEVRSTPIYLPP
jgi:chromosome segregation ATPase